jgi:hypothetical protein
MFRMISGNHFASRGRVLGAFPLLLASLLVLGLASCGDDDETTPTPSNQEQMEEGLSGLMNVGASATNSRGASVLQNSAVMGLLAGMNMELPGIGGLGTDAPGLETKRAIEAMLPRVDGLGLDSLDDFYGTYDRDLEDVTAPFPGWVLTTPNDPADGLIFRFPADPNDIYYIDPQTGAVVAVGGEIRFLNINDDFDPTDPSSEITEMTFELALAPEGEELQLVARITYDVEYNPLNGDLTAATIGSLEDLNASFIESTSFAIVYDTTIDGLLVDATLTLLIVERSVTPYYAVRFDLEVDDYNPLTEIPGAATFTFTYGPVSGATPPFTPPWVFTTTLSNFRQDPEELLGMIADIQGSISENGQVLATFAGDTSTVQVNADLNGDGEINELDTCLNVTITFSDGQSGNVCVVFMELMNQLPAGGVGALIAGPYCPCAR